MLKNWENENDQVKEKRQRVVGEKRRDDNPSEYDVEKQTNVAEKDTELSQLLQKTHSLSGKLAHSSTGWAFTFCSQVLLFFCRLLISWIRLTFFSPLAGSIFNFASKACEKLTESVAETAQSLRESVEEGKLNEFIDKVRARCVSLDFCLFAVVVFFFGNNWRNNLRFISLPSDHPG